jgi:hypothetical protein
MAADVMVYANGSTVRNNRITVMTPTIPIHKDSGVNKAASDTYNFDILKDRLDDPTYYG